MPNPVVITRPVAQAQAFAQRVLALGRKPIIFPLMEIHPLENPVLFHAELARLDNYALVAFVSPNAIDAVFQVISAWPKQVALAVMGEGSRAALARHGITPANAHIVSPLNAEKTDSETLLEALDLNWLTGKQVLVVRGENGRELLADALRSAGTDVVQVAAYRRTVPVMNAARRTELQHLVNSQNDWIVTSSEALRNLTAMAGQVVEKIAIVKLLQQKLIVPHKRIEESAKALGFQQIILTGSGDEQLLAALQS